MTDFHQMLVYTGPLDNNWKIGDVIKIREGEFLLIAFEHAKPGGPKTGVVIRTFDSPIKCKTCGDTRLIAISTGPDAEMYDTHRMVPCPDCIPEQIKEREQWNETNGFDKEKDTYLKYLRGRMAKNG